MRVTEPPVDGRANAATCRLVAKAIGIAPSKVRVLRGTTSRDKVLEVEGLAQEQVDGLLGLGDEPRLFDD